MKKLAMAEFFVEVPDEVKEWFKGAMTEIGAGKILAPMNEAERAYNNACERALRIVSRYREGNGLFQIPDAPAKDGE